MKLMETLLTTQTDCWDQPNMWQTSVQTPGLDPRHTQPRESN